MQRPSADETAVDEPDRGEEEEEQAFAPPEPEPFQTPSEADTEPFQTGPEAEPVVEEPHEAETTFEPEPSAAVPDQETESMTRHHEEAVAEEEGVDEGEEEVELPEPEPFQTPSVADTGPFQTEPEAEPVVEEPDEVEPEFDDDSLPTPQFGKRDPEEKAQRLARVLVSDIILYNPDRHRKALETDNLEDEFEEEIGKSWEEYVEQVGEDLAERTDYFTQALNEILARGRSVF